MKCKLKEDYQNDYDIAYLLDRLEAFTNRLKPLLSDELYYRLFSKPKCSTKLEDYCYRELCHTYIQDGERKWSKWERVKSRDVIKYIRKYPNSEVYYTVQKFRFPQKVNGEDFVMPLFFDLDADNLLDALIDCQCIITMLLAIGIPDNLIQVGFSGNKGFHVVVDEEIFGLRPSQDMHKKIEHIHNRLRKDFGLPTLCPASGNRKMLRVQNTINLKSGLYKISLKPMEIFKLDNNSVEEYIDKMLIMAKQPKKSVKIEKPFMIESAKTWMGQTLNDYASQKFGKILGKKIETIPPCVRDLIDNNIKIEGMRNKATMILSEFYKDYGVDEIQTKYLVNSWVKRIPNELTSTKGNNLKTLTDSCVHSVFASDHYHFDCSFIKSLPWKISCNKECKLNVKN